MGTSGPAIITRLASWPLFWASLAISAGDVVCINFLKLPGLVAAALGYTGGLDLFQFDAAWWPVPDYARVLTSYSAAGRGQLVFAHLSWDLVFPVAYALAGASALGLLALPPVARASAIRAAGLIALAAGAVDLLENLSIVDIALRYPAGSALEYGTTTALTHLKWLLVVLAIGTILYAIVAKLWAKAPSPRL